MPIHNYWLGIMAAAFVIALAIWILLVLNADKHPEGNWRGSVPRRDVTGGSFAASEGGRQVMPDPREAPTAQAPSAQAPGTHPDSPAVPTQRQPAERRQSTGQRQPTGSSSQH